MSHQDQRPYSAGVVEAYLPSVWDDEWILQPVSRRSDASGVRTKTDPRHVPEHLIAAADVQIGYRRAGLTHQERECLRHVHHLGYTPGAIASVWGVPSEQVHLACLGGIQRITEFLNRKAPA